MLDGHVAVLIRSALCHIRKYCSKLNYIIHNYLGSVTNATCQSFAPDLKIQNKYFRKLSVFTYKESSFSLSHNKGSVLSLQYFRGEQPRVLEMRISFLLKSHNRVLFVASII